MIEWTIILTIIILFLLFNKIEHKGKEIAIVILILFLSFSYFASANFFKDNGFKFNSVSNIGASISAYSVWVYSGFVGLFNFGKNTVSMVGNVIRDNWPEKDDIRR